MNDAKGNKPRKSAGMVTRIVSAGRHPENAYGFVNPPVYHGSTVLYPNVESYRKRDQPYLYGRRGTPTSSALEDALSEIEGAHGTKLFPSGLAAINTVLTLYARTGHHILVSDNLYYPARAFCEHILPRFGVEVEYFDSMIGAGIADLIRDNTGLIYVESPGSLTFEIADVPAIARAAKAAGVTTAMDNTWASPLFFRPLEHGIDISISAATKHVGGHSDIMLGYASVNEANWATFARDYATIGQSAGPDDIYLALRGLRTLSVRLHQHMENGIALATWLGQRPEVEAVLHPALPGCPGHDLWKRDCDGACGLFSIVLKPVAQAAADALIDSLSLFGLGASWGGYESLVIPANPNANRSVMKFPHDGPVIRLHAGLENVDDLKRDLEAGFVRLHEVAAASRAAPPVGPTDL